VDESVLERFRDRYQELLLDEPAMFEFEAFAGELFRGIGFEAAWPRASDYVEYLSQEMDHLLVGGQQQRN
jgi:hypothetical protein